MVRSMRLPSIFGVLLPVCLISVLPEPGNATKCRIGRETETERSKARPDVCDKEGTNDWKCYALFCSAQNGLVFLNSWGCYGDAVTQAECVTEGENVANKHRTMRNMSTGFTDWKCKCEMGNAGTDMTNEKFESPAAKMACKYRMESENAELNEQLNKKLNERLSKNEKIQCIKEKGKCGAVFCKAKDGELKLKWRKWACFSSDYAKKACAKNEANAVNDERAKWSDSKLPKADHWKCRCIFGDNGTDMTNEKFVPKNATAIRHGDGMPMMLVGIIMAILPPFHHAILDQLQMN